jgi:tRNA 2-thiocytidine biosynthesis protein TtcA
MSSILSAFCCLNQTYQLIVPDQKVLLAVSGGLDSLAMAVLLRDYQRASGINLDLQAVYIRISQVALSKKDLTILANFLSEIQIQLKMISGKVSSKNDFSCYPCAKERRKQLSLYAKKNNFDVVAIGHNLEDYLETGLMNLIYHGTLESLPPRQLLFDGAVTFIRPLLSISRKHIVAYLKRSAYSGLNAHCSYAADNKRLAVRRFIKESAALNRSFRQNLQSAINRWNQQEI